MDYAGVTLVLKNDDVSVYEPTEPKLKGIGLMLVINGTVGVKTMTDALAMAREQKPKVILSVNLKADIIFANIPGLLKRAPSDVAVYIIVSDSVATTALASMLGGVVLSDDDNVVKNRSTLRLFKSEKTADAVAAFIGYCEQYAGR